MWSIRPLPSIGDKYMKILIVNKFLYPNGGSETYIFKLGEELKRQGHEVQYFGMEHEGRIAGNRVNAYTSDMDFHGGSRLKKLIYPLKTIYSWEARRKIREVLDDFKPDVVHLNNFTYQLTPSIIVETRKWEKQTGHKVKIIATAHDSQLVCPNHLMQNPGTGEACTKCLGGKYGNCIKGKCIHGSTAKSIVGAAEAKYWNCRKIYRQIDIMISPSRFLADVLGTDPILKDRLIVLRNFVGRPDIEAGIKKEDYVLYLGRFSFEKGIGTLLEAIDEILDIRFVFAGNGPLEDEVNKRSNIENKGFITGTDLFSTIAKARFVILPSECYENCPFSVMESQMCGTPVLGSDRGGIPELIQVDKTGILFEPGNVESLKNGITKLWKDKALTDEMSDNCRNVSFMNVEEYVNELLRIIYKRD